MVMAIQHHPLIDFMHQVIQAMIKVLVANRQFDDVVHVFALRNMAMDLRVAPEWAVKYLWGLV